MNLPEQDDPEFERWREENPGRLQIMAATIIMIPLIAACVIIYFIHKFWYP